MFAALIKIVGICLHKFHMFCSFVKGIMHMVNDHALSDAL